MTKLLALFPTLQFKDIDTEPPNFPFCIPPYYLSLVNFDDPNCPIGKMAIPSIFEKQNRSGQLADPICEQQHAIQKGVIQRYPDRALLLVTNKCAMYCRHCTRRIMGQERISPIEGEQIQSALQYIRRHPHIEDVIISGGDPLLLEDDPLLDIIQKVRAIPSVKIIRLATRTPVTLPMRISKSLAKKMAAFGPIFINTQFNHPKELTAQSRKAIAHLVNTGILVNNQSVLLKGVNDTVEIMEKLCKTLLHNRIRPYYLFMCDLVKGTEHFRVPLTQALSIMAAMRGKISGLAIPQLIIDLPKGLGKIPICPDHIVTENETSYTLRAPDGQRIIYPKAL